MDKTSAKDLTSIDYEARALRLAETTDLSPQQAKELLKKHKGDMKKILREAENFKAES